MYLVTVHHVSPEYMYLVTVHHASPEYMYLVTVHHDSPEYIIFLMKLFLSKFKKRTNKQENE
jgi:hypothetical protein